MTLKGLFNILSDQGLYVECSQLTDTIYIQDEEDSLSCICFNKYMYLNKDRDRLSNVRQILEGKSDSIVNLVIDYLTTPISNRGIE